MLLLNIIKAVTGIALMVWVSTYIIADSWQVLNNIVKRILHGDIGFSVAITVLLEVALIVIISCTVFRCAWLLIQPLYSDIMEVIAVWANLP